MTGYGYSEKTTLDEGPFVSKKQLLGLLLIALVFAVIVAYDQTDNSQKEIETSTEDTLLGGLLSTGTVGVTDAYYSIDNFPSKIEMYHTDGQLIATMENFKIDHTTQVLQFKLTNLADMSKFGMDTSTYKISAFSLLTSGAKLHAKDTNGVELGLRESAIISLDLAKSDNDIRIFEGGSHQVEEIMLSRN